MVEFRFKKQWYSNLSHFPEEMIKEMLYAIYLYGKDGKIYTDDPTIRMFLNFCKSDIDLSRVRSESAQKKRTAPVSYSVANSEQIEITSVPKNEQNENKSPAKENQYSSNHKTNEEQKCSKFETNEEQKCSKFETNNKQNEIKIEAKRDQTHSKTCANASKTCANASKTCANDEQIGQEKEIVLPPNNPSPKEKEYKEKEEKKNLSKSEIFSLPLEISPEIQDERIPYKEIVSMWNAMSKEIGLPSIRTLTEDRKRRLRVRWKEWCAEEIGGIDTFKAICSRIRGSDFLRGDNNRGWTVKFDWILENGTNWVKIIEDSYKNKSRAAPSERTSNSYNNEEIW